MARCTSNFRHLRPFSPSARFPRLSTVTEATALLGQYELVLGGKRACEAVSV